MGPKTTWVSHLHLFFLLGLASNGPKRPKSPFLGSVRVGPTHGLIALVRFAVGLDNFCPETDEIQQFSCTIFLPFFNLSTLSILKIINKSVIVHFHPDFDLYPNCFFWHSRVGWTLTYLQRVATWKEGTVVVSLLDIHTWASNTTRANLYNVHFWIALFVVPCIHHSQECLPYVLKCVSPNPCRCFSTDGFHVWHSTFLPLPSSPMNLPPNVQSRNRLQA